MTTAIDYGTPVRFKRGETWTHGVYLGTQHGLRRVRVRGYLVLLNRSELLERVPVTPLRRLS